jgi:RNA polymerase sigma-70 factor (family 1)
MSEYLSDRELVLLLKGGSKPAFTEIYDRYGATIYYKVNQMLRDEAAAKDLVQDVFMSIWTKPDKIDENNNLSGFLYITARNRVFDLIDKGKVRNDYLVELGAMTEEMSLATMEYLDEKELMQLIYAEIAKMPPKMREVFQLSRVEDLSHKEIAERLGISEATVRKHVQHALRILRDKLLIASPYGLMMMAWLRQ